MYIHRIAIENVRGFGPKQVDLVLDRDGKGTYAGWTVIAGRNGSGKTSLLTLRFLRLLAEVRSETATVEVSSVSKTRESLREAPATAIVVTAEEIERRGYHDLEALLDDLPGFDVSRTNGWTYSNVYLRGYRSDETNRMLVLIDIEKLMTSAEMALVEAELA